MQIDTRHFGLIEINEETILDFPEGIPGFEDVNQFVLLGQEEDDSPFLWLQGVDNTDLAFAVIDPRVIKLDYVVDVEDAEVEILGIRDTEKVLMYAIVVVPEDISQMTANLKAPILINADNNKGKQVVMVHEDYPIKYRIFEERQKLGG